MILFDESSQFLKSFLSNGIFLLSLNTDWQPQICSAQVLFSSYNQLFFQFIYFIFQNHPDLPIHGYLDFFLQFLFTFSFIHFRSL